MEDKKDKVDSRQGIGENDKAKKVNKEKKLRWIGWLILVIILILLALVLNKCSGKNSLITKGDIVASKTEKELQVETKDENNDFSVFLNKNVYVDKDGMANILVKNDVKNKYDAYVIYFIADKEIIRTDIIQPGYKQEYADIGKSLTEGEHKGKALFCIVDTEGNNLNTVTTPITITK